MKRTWMLALLALILAPAANATVSVSLDADPYLGGSTITLTVRVTANAGEMDGGVFGSILYPSTLVTPVGTAQQNALPGGWTLGPLSCTTTRCIAFSQIRLAGPVAVDLTNFVIATLTFSLNGVSPQFPISFSWQSTPPSQQLDFFGVTSAPGTCVTSMDQPPCPIPEPTPAALLGFGFVGLALARRRRS